MKEYQPFAISNFRTGFDEAVEPWLLPKDAYQTMVNAHLYRGVLEKIAGYRLFAKMSYRTEVKMTPNPDGATTTFTTTLPTTPTSSNFLGYGTLVLGSTAEKFTYLSDASPTLIDLQGSNGGTGTVNLSTLVVTLNFMVAPPAGIYSNVFFQWDSQPVNSMGTPTLYAIMGIKQYFASNGSQQIMVFDQQRVGLIVSNFGVLSQPPQAIQVVSEIPHDYYQSAVFTGDEATLTFTGTLTANLITPGTVHFIQYTSGGVFVSNISDNGFGSLSGTNVNSALSFINYATGAYTITFTVAPASGNVFDSTAGVYGNHFTGTISNFFSLTNYQFKAFFTNSVDPIQYYDGTSIKYLNTNLTTKNVTATGGVPAYDISKCLHVFTNRERLLLISVTVNGVQAVSTVFWSVAENPLDFTTANNAGNLQAPTSEPIRAIGFINSDLMIRFASSERAFRYTGDAFSPFRFDSRNSVWDCDAPYSTINYDTWFSSVGRPGIVGSFASDSTNVQRVDEIIPDFTDPYRLALETPTPYMNQTSVQQCYGERFDDLKEGWLCYNSVPAGELSVTASDNILSFSYIDNTYAIYSFPMSCLGFGRIINVPTWGTTFTKWEDMASTWGAYNLQSNALIDLGGDQFDSVYELNSGNTQTVAGDSTTTPEPVVMSVISANFNPFIDQGQLARLGYLDLFVSADADATLRVQFYISDQLYIDSSGNPAGFYQETILTFNTTDAMSPNTNQTKVWKRIYVGAVGKEHTIRFYQQVADLEASTDDQPIYIHAMVLYMKPAGRIFQ
jgi:hypothetical protein